MNNLERIEQLKRYEDLLYKTVEKFNIYLILNNVGYFDTIDIFETIGFNRDEMKEFGIIDENYEQELEKRNNNE